MVLGIKKIYMLAFKDIKKRGTVLNRATHIVCCIYILEQEVPAMFIIILAFTNGFHFVFQLKTNGVIAIGR
jgi:hypothetical protein